MAPSTQRDNARSLRGAELAAVTAAIVATLSVMGPALGLRQSTLVAVTIPALFGVGFALIAGRRVLATRTIPVTIAIGGAEKVGKTVYTNVVAGRLGESESASLRFTPEARTAQQVYRVISDLRRKRWPPSTGSDDIDRYRGKVELRDQPLYSRLVRGRIEFDLELGDSAGALWEEVAHPEPKESSRLIDSTFFEYVGESSALLYFIAADTLRGEPGRVADHVDDLVSTIQVLRNIEARGTPQLTKPIGVVISKADLLSRAELDALRGLFSSMFRGSEPTPRLDAGFSNDFSASMERLEHLTTVMSRQVRACEGFIVSAIGAAQPGGSAKDPLASVEHPVEWVIREILRS